MKAQRTLKARKRPQVVNGRARYQVVTAIGGDYDACEVTDTHADHPNKRVLCRATNANARRIVAALNKE